MKQPMMKDYKLKDRLLGLEDIVNYMLHNYKNQFDFAYDLAGYAIGILQEFYSMPSANNPMYMPALSELIGEALKIADYENGLALMIGRIMEIIYDIMDLVLREYADDIEE